MKQALEAFNDLHVDKVTMSGLVDVDPNWLNSLEISAFRTVALLKHVRCNFDAFITRLRMYQAAVEATQKKVSELKRRLEDAEVEKVQLAWVVQEKAQEEERIQMHQSKVAGLRERLSAEEAE